MVNCKVKNWQGEEVSETSLELKVAKEESAAHIVHRALVRQLAMARQGTASTKTRSEVRGGGRKPWRQKGTGRARAGSSRSPLWRGGGVTFGPKPRDYSVKMNKKERRLALRTAFYSCLESAVVVEDFTAQVTAPKTKEILSALDRWGVDKNSKVLLIVNEISDNLHLSTRNIVNVKILKAGNLNVYDLLNAQQVVVTTDALTKIEEVYGERV